MKDVSAPTLWEEGRWSASRVTRFSVLASTLLVGLDLLVTGELSLVFDSGFVLLSVGLALAIRPDEFFRVGILPPLLLFAVTAILALAHRGAIADPADGPIQALISGLAHHSGALFAGYALCLIVLAIRQRVIARHRAAMANRAGYSNRAVSPAPTREISGTPEVKSTTVVGSDPDSPSMTASNC